MADANDAAESKEDVDVKVEEPIKEEEVSEEVTKKLEVEEPPAEKKELAIEDKGKATKEQIEEVRLGKFYSVKQVATSLGFSTAYISYLLAGDSTKGIPPRIHGVKVLGGSWRIPQSEYDRLTKEGPLPLKDPADKKQVTKIKVEAEPEEKADVKVKEKKIGKAEEKPDKFPHFRFNLLNLK